MNFRLLIVSLFSLLFVSISAQEILCIETVGNDATVSWDPPAAPCGPFVSYELWAANSPTAAFTLVTTVVNQAQTSFTHINGLNIGDPIYYYIIYNYNCPGVPPVISEIATSAFNNSEPEIQSIQVNGDSIIICWEESEFIQTAGYVISYLLPNGLAQAIDTVFGISNTCFIDTVSNILDPALSYTLSYIDACDQQTLYNDIGYQLILASSDQQGCNQLIEYEWNQYDNPYGLDFSYNIYVQINGGPVELVGNQPSGQNIFNFFDFIDQDTVKFSVEVIDENGVPRSNSPIQTDTAQIVQPPREFYIYYLSVANNNQIDISYYIDTISELRNMEIDTSKLGSDFDMVARYDATLFPGLGDIYLPDTVSPTYNGSRYYQIIANDSCNEDHFSTIGRTIFAEAGLFDFFENTVSWNAFELENAVVNTYRLFRDYGAGLQLIQTLGGGNATYDYIDNISDFINQNGTFCYKIEAEYTFTHPDGSTESFVSSSNIACVEQRPAVYIPNAIAPNGTNNEFKPLIVFGNPTDYKMMIFNRWGELIFENNDPNSGWFGTNNGSEVPTGGYPYVIRFTASDGAKIEKKGIVTVVR